MLYPFNYGGQQNMNSIAHIPQKGKHSAKNIVNPPRQLRILGGLMDLQNHNALFHHKPPGAVAVGGGGVVDAHARRGAIVGRWGAVVLKPDAVFGYKG